MAHGQSSRLPRDPLPGVTDGELAGVEQTLRIGLPEEVLSRLALTGADLALLSVACGGAAPEPEDATDVAAGREDNRDSCRGHPLGQPSTDPEERSARNRHRRIGVRWS